MAVITPRTNEVAAMLAILTDGTYPSEQHMARALLKAAYEQFRLRDWHVVGVVPGSEPNARPLAFYGLEPSESAMAKEITATLEVGGRAMVLPVFSLQALADRRRELEVVWGKSDLCGRCRHREAQHGFTNHRGGRVKTPATVAPCSVSCACDRFIPQKEWAEMVKVEKAREAEIRALAQEREEEAYGDGSVQASPPEVDDGLEGFELPSDY